MFAEVHESVQNMDEYIYRLASTLSHFSPDAMAEMKKVFWQGTANWDALLSERAAMSGKLILSEYARAAISKLKVKIK
jgi:methylglutaconyl-CoA hydratase